MMVSSVGNMVSKEEVRAGGREQRSITNSQAAEAYAKFGRSSGCHVGRFLQIT